MSLGNRACHQLLPVSKFLDRHRVTFAGRVQANKAVVHGGHDLGLALDGPANGVGGRQAVTGNALPPKPQSPELFVTSYVQAGARVRDRGQFCRLWTWTTPHREFGEEPFKGRSLIGAAM